ncbi:hypothetical protein MHYP_G00141520 [Metynnis hypsauchen]
MAKLSVIHLGIFLICSVTATREKSYHETDLKFEEPTMSFLDNLIGKYGNHTPSLKEFPNKCCMCQESVRAVRFLVLNEIQQKIDDICNVVKSVRDQCISKGNVYKQKVIQALFPGGPKGICKVLKMCK